MISSSQLPWDWDELFFGLLSKMLVEKRKESRLESLWKKQYQSLIRSLTASHPTQSSQTEMLIGDPRTKQMNTGFPTRQIHIGLSTPPLSDFALGCH